MSCNLIVIHLISLSFTGLWNEDERTNKKAIITVAMMMCQRKPNHQANFRFAANYRVYRMVGIHAMECCKQRAKFIGLVSCIILCLS